MKYWIESSYKFEDKKKEYDEHLIVSVDMGYHGTESIGSFPINVKSDLECLIKRINELKE